MTLRQFSELVDSIQSFWINVDTVTGDTTPAGSGVPTCGFDSDLVVDKYGHPHILAVVANAGSGGVTPAYYTISSALRMFAYDFTFDEFGDWNMMYVGPQRTFRGTFGDPTENNSADPYFQLSRSPDGDLIFYSYTDSDTTGNFGNSDNNDPNLIGRALCVSTQKLTPIQDWTFDDPNWASRALLPHVAPVALDNGNGIYSVPTVIMDQGTPDNSWLNPMSFWYFSDIAYDKFNDFTIDADYFYNCKEDPFSNQTNQTDPNCGQTDGSVAVTAAGGNAPYTYSWNAAAGGSDSASAINLAAGIYTVTVTDSLGCTDEISVTLNNANAPVITVDSTSNIACFGQANGYASVSATGSTGIMSYSWSNNETGPVAMALPAGTHTVTVTDSAGCESFETVTVSEPPIITVATTNTDILCFGEETATASALASGGTGNLSFAWDNGDTTANIADLPAGTYNLTVTDEKGCQQFTAITVSQPDSLQLTVTVTANNTNPNPPFNGQVFVSSQGGTGNDYI